jgi:hypothetical protein
MGKKVGFTGTNRGMSEDQKTQVEELLKKLFSEGFTDFHHGLCVGADQQAAEIAKRLGYRVIAHPGLARDPSNLLYRSDFTGNDETREAKPFVKRDHDIVDETDRMIAAPLTKQEQVRSGTWSTVRYARRQKKEIALITRGAK